MKRTLATAAILAMLWSGLSCSPGSERNDSVVIAFSPFESTALFWVAEEQRLFANNGLTVTLRQYDTGAGSLDGVLKGEADMTVGVAEFPVVVRALQKQEMRVISSLDRGEFIFIVGHKDRGIEKASDLKGKRVGTTKGTIAEFHLGRFLTLHGLRAQDITLVDLKTPAEWVDAIVNGDVDAISTAQPYVNAIQARLGDNAVTWAAQSNQPLYALIVSTDAWTSQHPQAIVKLLRSLAQAEEYVVGKPAEAKAIVQKRLNLDPVYVATVWEQNQFSLSLDQSLILAMEDEARWMIRNNLTTEKTVPNFLSYIYEDGLKVVRPNAVKIIR